MNRLERDSEDTKQPGETWARYIKRRIGKDNFNSYNELDLTSGRDPQDEIVLHSSLKVSGYGFGVEEVVDLGVHTDDVDTLMPFTQIEFNRELERLGEGSEDIISVIIYGNNSIEILDYDPIIIPPDVVATFEAYKENRDVQQFVDGIIGTIKKLLDENGPPPSTPQ